MAAFFLLRFWFLGKAKAVGAFMRSDNRTPVSFLEPQPANFFGAVRAR
jgi:hypothetical protein